MWRSLVSPLAFTFPFAVLPGCAVPAANLAPLPAPPPTCPVDGCGDRAQRSAAGGGAADACLGLGGVCAGAPAEECTARALASWGEAQDDHVLPCVARMFSEACAQGDPRACGFGGRLWLDGYGVAPDPARGLEMLARGCDGGFVLACSVALRWLSDASHKTDADDSGDLHTRLEGENGCWMGQADACLQVGRILRVGGEGVVPDLAQAARVFARGCDLGERVSCNMVAVALTYGDGVARDLEHAVALYDRSCRLGAPLGCANLGYMTEHGAGVAPDTARARALYREACVAGDSYGCRHVEMMAAETAQVPRDPKGEVAYWQRRCEGLHEGRACSFLSLLYLDGPDGFARDDAKSAELLSRACRLGHKPSCDWVRESQDE